MIWPALCAPIHHTVCGNHTIKGLGHRRAAIGPLIALADGGEVVWASPAAVKEWEDAPHRPSPHQTPIAILYEETYVPQRESIQFHSPIAK